MSGIPINVHIGEVKISQGGHELQTILGSCIGIALLWPKHGMFGLAHCLLPEQPASEKPGLAVDSKNPSRRKATNEAIDSDIVCGEGRYVDQAVDCLLSMMNTTHLRDIRAVVAGGANMTKPGALQPEKLVGHLNAQCAIKQLKAKRIIIIDQDVGGEIGRKLTICGQDGSHIIRRIPRLTA